MPFRLRGALTYRTSAFGLVAQGSCRCSLALSNQAFFGFGWTGFSRRKQPNYSMPLSLGFASASLRGGVIGKFRLMSFGGIGDSNHFA